MVDNKAECTESNFHAGGYFSIEHCAASCYGRATMFTYGTNEFQKQRCWGINQCECYCWPGASIDGVCDRSSHKGYNLYKLASKGRSSGVSNVTNTLLEAYFIDHISEEKFTESSFEYS